MASLASGVLFLRFFAFGVIYGICGLVPQFFAWLFRHNVIIINSLYFCYYSLLGMLFCSLLLKLASGALAFYMVLGVALGLILQQITLQKLFTNVAKVLYNALTKCVRRLKKVPAAAKILK